MANRRAPSDNPSGPRDDRLVLGWWEWVALPALDVPRIRAKLDTGARSSALHVAGYRTFVRDAVEWVRFTVDPDPRRPTLVIEAEAPVLDERMVRSSSGEEQLRITIRTPLRIGDREWPVDVTLSRRDAMRFRMLVGREGLRDRAVVDPSVRRVAGKPSRVPTVSEVDARSEEEEE